MTKQERQKADRQFHDADLDGDTTLVRGGGNRSSQGIANNWQGLDEIRSVFGMLGELLDGEEFVGAKHSLLERIFNALDYKHDKKVSLDEWRAGTAVLAKGSTAERRRFGFGLIDMDNDGFITQVDLAEAILSCHATLVRMGLSVVNAYPKDIAEKIFQEASAMPGVGSPPRLSFDQYCTLLQVRHMISQV